MPPILAIIHWHIDPVAFHLGPVAVRWYGMLFAVAFLTSYAVMVGVFRKEHRSPEALEKLTIYIIVGTVVGARLGHCLFYDPGYYLTHPIEILQIWKGGLASHGGAIGIIVAAWLFARRTPGFTTLWVLDRIAIVVPLAGMFVRIGNFFNSEILGHPTDVPWAIVFDRVGPQPRHPAQLYEALSYLVIFALTYGLYRGSRGRIPQGRLLGVTLTAIFIARFLIEFVKVRQAAFAVPVLSMGQWLSIPMIIIGVVLIVRSFSHPGGQPATGASEGPIA